MRRAGQPRASAPQRRRPAPLLRALGAAAAACAAGLLAGSRGGPAEGAGEALRICGGPAADVGEALRRICGARLPRLYTPGAPSSTPEGPESPSRCGTNDAGRRFAFFVRPIGSLARPRDCGRTTHRGKFVLGKGSRSVGAHAVKQWGPTLRNKS
ncbi:unnamed protein product [Prorocentrum cordatum]|uniref:Uncharacterized protein n=1 Tax=Prorocentrum cordatum TaxID=2364126 RepID=A0ABN9P6J9_9DINO|nr:unnamed protein product [Polarella glacialis]